MRLESLAGSVLDHKYRIEIQLSRGATRVYFQATHLGITCVKTLAELVRRCPSAGHVLLAVGLRFALGGAVELEYGVDADLPDSLEHGSPLVIDSDFALVFVAAQFTFDGDVSTLVEGAGEVSQLPEGDASMPFGPGFPSPGVILPGRFGRD